MGNPRLVLALLLLPYKWRGLADAQCTLRLIPRTPRRTHSETPRRLRVHHGESKANALVVSVVTHGEHIAKHLSR